MTPEERIDAALECILEMACCASLEYLREMHPRRYYEMRDAMRKIMEDSFNDGISSTLGVREVFNKS